MRINQRQAAFTFQTRAGALAALMALSLAGCAAVGPVASGAIEGPVRLGETAAVDGPRVRPDRVIEDSRCPADVQCIHAGRLMIQATVFAGRAPEQIELTLGVAAPVADGILTLVEATPVPIVGEAATAAARFTFTFKGGR